MGDEVLIENSQTITPKKVVDVSSQMMQGNLWERSLGFCAVSLITSGGILH